MKGRQPIRFGGGELIEDDGNTHIERHIAWTHYLLAAAQIQPEIITCLLTEDGFEALRKTRERRENWVHKPEWSDMPVPPSPDDPLNRFIRAWCDRWGFFEYFARTPANNLLVEAARLRAEGKPKPETFTCDCAGVPLDPDERKPWQRSAVICRVQDPLIGRWKTISGIGSGAKWSLNVPELTWNPREELRSAALARIMPAIESIVACDLDRIRSEYMADGYKPVPSKRAPEHFEWVARYQLLHEDKEEIARSEGYHERHVRREIIETARLLGIALRVQRRGRPRRQTARTVTARASRK